MGKRLKQLFFTIKYTPYEQIFALLMIIIAIIIIILRPGLFAFAFMSFALLLPLTFKFPKVFFVILISTKMVINSLYNVYFIGNINILMIIGVLVPIFLIAYMAVVKIDFRNYPYYLLISIFLIEVTLGSLITIYGTHDLNELEKLFRLLNGFSCYFAIPLIFREKKDINIFMVAWVISVSFPLLIALFQIFTGSFRFQLVAGIEGLVRIAGIYHDVGTIAFSGQIFILLMFFFQDKFKTTLQKFVWIILLVTASFIIYQTYSKSAAVILVIMLTLWALMQKKFTIFILSGLALILIFFSEKSGVYKRIEYDIISRQKFGDRLMFSGRYGIWERNIEEFMKYSMLQKVIGHEVFGAHNDFLRVLLDNGFLGLIFYTGILVAILIRLLRCYRYATKNYYRNLLLIAFLSQICFILVAFSTHPSLYTDYQWFHWGLVGIALVNSRKSNDPDNEIA